MIGVRASVGMGDTRSIRVFVMGEANRPGSYTVSGLATITSALYAAGGIKPIGSLRDIQLKRQGAVVRRLDLYDLLLRGDTSDDTKLLPGDVIFIPPVAATVAIDGEVHRPAIYELRGNTTVAEVVRLAGGLTRRSGHQPRGAGARERTPRPRRGQCAARCRQRSQRAAAQRRFAARAAIASHARQGVTIEGHVFRPGPVAWREGLRLTDVIGSVDELKPNADLNYVLIRRELPPDRRVVMLSADLARGAARPGVAEEHCADAARSHHRFRRRVGARSSCLIRC